jgi:conjugal transfer ATP-binding protein TraC
MTYEIPKQLKYKEIILFGLTFEQLIPLFLIIPIIVVIFKLEFTLTQKIIFSVIPICFALIFMFTDIPKQLYNLLIWFGFRNADILTSKMKSYINIDGINNNILETRNKKLAIIEVQPINFSIKNKKEQDSIIFQFQKLLNGINFPIQILISTTSLNLDDYLNNLEKKITKEDYEIFDDYKQFLNKIIKSKGLLNRKFHIIIPEEYDLSIQIKICETLIRSLGLQYKRLKTEEIKKYVSSFFNDLYSDDNKTENIKEISKEDYLHYCISPKVIENNSNYMKIDNQFIRTIAVKDYPRAVQEGFLDNLITLNGKLDISLHIRPFLAEETMINVNSELQKQQADLWALEKKEISNPALEIQFNDTKKVLEKLQRGEEKLFDISLYITCRAESLEELNSLTNKIESELNSTMMVPKQPNYLMHLGFQSTLPFGLDKLNEIRNITTQPLSAFFPFSSRFLELDENGICLGFNQNNIPLIKDIFKLHNSNGVILASSGGGKSYFTKLMIARSILNGTQINIIDPQGEYTHLVESFNGQVIDISKNSSTIINPLDLMGHDFDEKKLVLLDLFGVMLGGVSEIQKSVLDRALTLTYNKKGITDNLSTWRRKPPIMEDLRNELTLMSKTATIVEKETYRSLINRLEMYVTGAFRFLNRQTNLNFNNRFVCFNIGDMPIQVKPTIMFLILDYVYMQMKTNMNNKLLIIDEAWSLLEKTEDESYIFKIVKTCRKFNLGLLLITQDVDDLLNNNAGKALLNNSEYTLLLRQKPAVMENIKATFQLSQKEVRKLLSSTQGEGILIIGNEHSEINILSSEKEHEIITKQREIKLKPTEIVKEFEPTVNLFKGYFKKRNLSEEQVDELIQNGYCISSLVGIFGGRREEYLLKPRFNESVEHFFLIKQIEEYVKQYTDNVILYETKDADLVFEINNIKVALEIETGKRIRNGKVRDFDIKIQNLNKKYKGHWYIVIVNWKDKEIYSKYGKTISRKEVPAILKKNYLLEGSNMKDSAS